MNRGNPGDVARAGAHPRGEQRLFSTAAVAENDSDNYPPQKRTAFLTEQTSAAGSGDDPLTTGGEQRYIVKPIPGIEAADEDDREDLRKLLFHALTVKCPDANLRAKDYDRASDWRVETSAKTYTLVLLDWKSRIDKRCIDRVWNWDAQIGDARNILDVATGMAISNVDPSVHVFSLFIVYKKEQARLRDLAQLGTRQMAVATASSVAAAALPPMTEASVPPAPVPGAPAPEKSHLISRAARWFMGFP